MTIRILRADASFAERIGETGRRAFVSDNWKLAILPARLKDPENPDAQQNYIVEMMKARLKDEGVYCVVAVDDNVKDARGALRVLGYAIWHAPGKGENGGTDAAAPAGPSEGIDQDDGWVDDGHGGKRGDGQKYPACMDVEAWRRIGRLLKRTKEEILGDQRPNIWYLGSLGVDPEFTRRGIATQLVQWGIEKCETDKVPAYLESSAAAKGVYTRLGFEAIRELPTPEDGGTPHMAMLRRPRTPQSRGRSDEDLRAKGRSMASQPGSTRVTNSASCLCGAVQVTVTGIDKGSVLCHCSNCQHASGSAFANNHRHMKAKIEFTKGENLCKEYADRDTKSGKALFRHFCTNCVGHSLPRSKTQNDG